MCEPTSRKRLKPQLRAGEVCSRWQPKAHRRKESTLAYGTCRSWRGRRSLQETKPHCLPTRPSRFTLSGGSPPPSPNTDLLLNLDSTWPLPPQAHARHDPWGPASEAPSPPSARAVHTEVTAWNQKRGLVSFDFRAGQPEKGILQGAAEGDHLLCSPLRRHMACFPTSEEVIIGAAQRDFFVKVEV